MSDDLGPGDVVEAVDDMEDDLVRRGDRATVAGIVELPPEPDGLAWTCSSNCYAPGVALILREYPLPPLQFWCVCGWRKIGGGRADTVGRFAHHLDTKTPALPIDVGFGKQRLPLKEDA